MGKNSKEKEAVSMTKKQKTLFVIALIIIVLMVYLILTNKKIDGITKVNKIFDEKYYDVKCINERCDYIIASSGDESKTSKKYIYNYNGKKISSYKENFNSNSKTSNEISEVSENYLIFKKVNKSNNDIIGYYLTDLKNNKKYSTSNELKYLTDNLILMKKQDGYEIITKDGKEKYSNIDSAKTFNNDKIVLINVNNTSVILDNKGEKILEDYTVSKEIKNNDGETLYLVIKDVKNNLFYYFDVDKKEIIGDNFQNFSEKDEKGNLIITKVKNNVLSKFILDKNGNQKKYTEKNTQKYANDIKMLIDSSKYYVYDNSVYKENQNNVFVNKKDDNTFGIYNVKDNKYKKLYDYYKENSKSNITEVNKNGIYQISCKKDNCKTNENLVYDLNNMKKVFDTKDNNLSILNYTSYENGYKNVKYNDNNNSKYILYNNDNKKVIDSSKQIIVIDDEISYTNDKTEDDVLLYSFKKNKTYNKENEEAKRINISEYTLYKYKTDNKTCIINNKGKKIECTKDNVKLSYSDDIVYYLNDDKIVMINAQNSMKNKYNLEKNEKMNDIKGDLIPLYRNTLFVNNSANDYIKVVSNTGRVIKKINNAEVVSVKQIDKTNVLIFTKNTIDNKDYFGLYLAN